MQQQTNPYYVEPMNLLPGVQALGGGMQHMAKQRVRQSALEKFKAGDYEAVADMIMKYPYLKQDIAAMTGMKDEEAKIIANLAKHAKVGNLGPLHAYAQKLNQSGFNAQPFLDMYEMGVDPTKKEEFQKNMDQIISVFAPDDFKKMIAAGKTGGDKSYKGQSAWFETPEGKQKAGLPIYKEGKFGIEFADVPTGYERLDEKGRTITDRLTENLMDRQNMNAEDAKKLANELNQKLNIEPLIKDAVTKAEIRAKSEEQQVQKLITDTVEVSKRLPDWRRVLTLMDRIENGVVTGGIAKWGKQIKDWLDLTKPPASLDEVTQILARDMLKQLKPLLGAQFSEKENKALEAIEAGISRSTAANINHIRNSIGQAEEAIKFAIPFAEERNQKDSVNIMNKYLEYTYDYSQDQKLKYAPSERFPEPEIEQSGPNRLTPEQREQLLKDAEILRNR